MDSKEQHSEDFHLSVEEFERLYKRYYQNLLNFSVKMVGDEVLAQDIVHEVFIKLWEKRAEIKDDGIEKLLFIMIRNTCLNHIKHLNIIQNKQLDIKNSRKWEEVYRVEFLRDDPGILIAKEYDEQFNRVVYRLPDRCREVFILSRKKGLKNWEIAEKLNISLKAVEKHISRAIKEFKKKMDL